MKRTMKRLFEKMTRKKKGQEEVNFWQSYSDLMAAMLLVFVLIIAFTIYHAKEDYENIDARLVERDKIIKNQKEQIEERDGTIAGLEAEVEEQGTRLEEQSAELREFVQQNKSLEDELSDLRGELDMVFAIRSGIVEELEKEFAHSRLEISVDPKTGTVSLDSDVLFDYDSSSLTKKGKETLDIFLPAYFSVILKYRDNISDVIIEGHTDDRGGYSYNMDLSQARAFAVANYCIGDETIGDKDVNYDMFSQKQLSQIREIVTANGRSYYDLRYDSSGNVDADASRRVEIKFRLKVEDISSF